MHKTKHALISTKYGEGARALLTKEEKNPFELICTGARTRKADT